MSFKYPLKPSHISQSLLAAPSFESTEGRKRTQCHLPGHKCHRYPQITCCMALKSSLAWAPVRFCIVSNCCRRGYFSIPPVQRRQLYGYTTTHKLKSSSSKASKPKKKFEDQTIEMIQVNIPNWSSLRMLGVFSSVDNGSRLKPT